MAATLTSTTVVRVCSNDGTTVLKSLTATSYTEDINSNWLTLGGLKVNDGGLYNDTYGQLYTYEKEGYKLLGFAQVANSETPTLVSGNSLPLTEETLTIYVVEEKEIVKGPNYIAFDDALDRLAVAIAERTGAELPLTLEEMLEAAKEIGQAALISFTISGTSYQAEEGMTWAQWANSDYNTNNKYGFNGPMTMYLMDSSNMNYYVYDTTTNSCVMQEEAVAANGVYNTKYVDPVGGGV